jgi:uncharacterized glyoxalase superfamily protein PhnB
VNLEFGDMALTLQIISPSKPGHHLGGRTWWIYNFAVDDVNAEHRQLTSEGLAVIAPLESHPWGDRGFAVREPNGITFYIYCERKPGEDLRQNYR